MQVIADTVGGQILRTDNVENFPVRRASLGPQLTRLIYNQLEYLKVDIKLARVAQRSSSPRAFSG